MMGMLGNVAEVQFLRCRLMNPLIISIFRSVHHHCLSGVIYVTISLVFGPRNLHAMHDMRSVATYFACEVVYVFVCELGTRVSCAKNS